MHIIWDRAPGNLKNHAMGKKSVGISFFSGYAHFVKWARSTGNFSILTAHTNYKHMESAPLFRKGTWRFTPSKNQGCKSSYYSRNSYYFEIPPKMSYYFLLL